MKYSSDIVYLLMFTIKVSYCACKVETYGVPSAGTVRSEVRWRDVIYLAGYFTAVVQFTKI
jgi:hypothetical protein